MRVCLASIHPRALSGQIEALVGLAKELDRRGHEVQVVSAFSDELIQGNRLTLAEHDGGLLVGKLNRIGNILTNLAKRAKLVDIIHLNLPTPAFAVLGDFLQRFVPVPVVIGFEAHLAATGRPLQFADVWASPSFYIPRLLVNNGFIARCTWHGAAHFIVSSHYQAAELRALGFPPTRISVVPNVVDTDKLQRLNQMDARRQLGLPDGPLVAYVGHYHHVKGVDILVEAFGHLIRNRDDCHLVLAWSGLGDARPVERAIETSGIGHRVLKLGRVPIGTVISAIDVLALPYRYTMGQNAFPGLIMEAMAIGVAMVTSDLPLLRELLQHEQTALLVPPGDGSVLAWGINMVLENKALTEEMTTSQRRLLAESLNPREVAKHYVRIYRQVRAGEAGILQPVGSEPQLRPPALWRAERRLDQPARTERSEIPAATRREDS